MALFSVSEVRNKQFPLYESAKTILMKSSDAPFTSQYDIFLSHSFKDADLIAKLKLILEDYGYSVYVDWLEDPQMNRDFVTKNTALILKMRMKQCKCLLYAVTGNSSNSKWMPWELGEFDGQKPQKVAILPVQLDGYRTNAYSGQEYLGIYPYITRDKIEGKNKDALWIRTDEQTYVIFDVWLTHGSIPSKRV